MRSLILFRHGKSDWDGGHAVDHDRPLAERGRRAAACMGRLLTRIDQVPDIAVSSTALRARDTLQLAAGAGRWRCELRFDARLYESTADEMLAWLHAMPDNPACLLLAGHEPTWSSFAGRLVGGATLRVATATMLRIDFETDDWQQARFGNGSLRWLLPPKSVCRLLDGD
jgi:phosphohistidine phosphatase